MQGLAGQFRAGGAFFLGQFNMGHSVYTVGGYAVAVRVSKQIAVFIILAKSVRTCQVFFFSVSPLATQIPVEIAEFNGFVLTDGFLNGVDADQNGLIHTFDPTGNQHVTLHKRCVMGVTLGAELLNQLFGLLFCQVAAGKYCIHQKL